MPVPRHSTYVPSAELPPEPDSGGVTELRVHGVGGTAPDALLADLAPTQVAGDRIAGFYRTSDHSAIPGQPDADRHVECYSWSGLTSRSKSRVLWLALLPFLLGNLAGWMCSPKNNRGWRFALHRASASLGALALTVNACLVAVMITADVLAYQAVRADVAGHQWWLAPLRLPEISGYPARQVLVGVLVPALFVLVLAWLARTSRERYEAVRPPFHGKKAPEPKPAPAAALTSGLADGDFWDGRRSVRLLSQVHLGVGAGFLAIVLAVTVRALIISGTGTPRLAALWWLAVCAGASAIVLAVAYLCAEAAGAFDRGGKITARVERAARPHKLLAAPLLLAVVAGLSAGLYAWLQPGGPGMGKAAAMLPGLASVIGWTALAIAVPVAAMAVSVALGAGERGSQRGRLPGGPLVTLALAFGLLNIVMLGVLTWVAHIVGPVTPDAAAAVEKSRPEIYIPYLITYGLPLIVLAALVASAGFAAVEIGRWRACKLPAPEREAYARDIEDYQAQWTKKREETKARQPDLSLWQWSALRPPKTKPGSPADASGDDRNTMPASGDPKADAPQAADNDDWEHAVGRARWIGQAPHDASWLLWGVIALQLVAVICTWQLKWAPPPNLQNAGTAVAVVLLTPLMAYVYSAWSKPDRRRRIAVVWDVGTFWPRSYHPFSPPCYAERAVPDLQRRLWWLRDNGGRVLVLAHSQGAMLAVAALVQDTHRPPDDHVALVTIGSPVCKLYAWAFPAYITPQLLTRLTGHKASSVMDWLNIYYPTDPIAGPMALGSGDERLLDPAQCWHIYGQPTPRVKGHSGYWMDRRAWEKINHCASDLSVQAPSYPPAYPPASTSS